MKSLLAALTLALCPALLHAQATRTWVSGVGDDANPDSRTAPGKTLAGAIGKTAAGGVIDILDPGDFGALTITKAITVDGPGAQAAVSVSGTNAIVISAGTTDVVVLRNLNLNGLNASSPAGIVINTAGTVVIENCKISGFVTGISLASTVAASQVLITGTTIENCSTSGITLAPVVAAGLTVEVKIENCNITDNGQGISAAPHTRANIVKTVCSGNGGAGFLATASGADVTLTGCVSCENVTGIQSGGALTMNGCSVFKNDTGLKHPGSGTITSYGNNSVLKNAVDGTPTTTTTLQ